MNFKKIALVALSNPLKNTTSVNLLIEELKNINIDVVSSKHLTLTDSILNRDYSMVASELLDFFKDSSIDGIFDVSGGDLCNSILEYLDFKTIEKNPKPFFGYSDLTVVLNSLYSQSNLPTYNYQIMNLIRDTSKLQIAEFKNTLINDSDLSLFNFNYKFLKGSSLKGTVIGGNIRCLLKLAGTPYFPDSKDKILLLESNSGDPFKIITFLTQYKSMGIFQNVSGIILGNFTEMESNTFNPSLEEIIQEFFKDFTFPIVKTFEIGHYPNSKCISIGSAVILT